MVRRHQPDLPDSPIRKRSKASTSFIASSTIKKVSDFSRGIEERPEERLPGQPLSERGNLRRISIEALAEYASNLGKGKLLINLAT
jgi:hypothetical protein